MKKWEVIKKRYVGYRSKKNRCTTPFLMEAWLQKPAHSAHKKNKPQLEEDEYIY